MMLITTIKCNVITKTTITGAPFSVNARKYKRMGKKKDCISN